MTAKLNHTLGVILAAGVIGAPAPALAGWDWQLPSSPNNAVLYGDFYSYSFPVLGMLDSYNNTGTYSQNGDGSGASSSGGAPSPYTTLNGTTTTATFREALGGPSDLDPVLMIYGDTQGERDNGDLANSGAYPALTTAGFEDAFISAQPTDNWFSTATGSNPDVRQYQWYVCSPTKPAGGTRTWRISRIS